MKIILHAGAHCTDEDRLLKCLLRNQQQLAARGVAVPGPSRYRQLLRETINALYDGVPDPNAREVLIDAFTEDRPENIERLLLSIENFFSVPKIALSDGVLYKLAVRKLQHLQELFPEDGIEIFFALRNPATWLPAVFAASRHEEMVDFLDGTDPRDIRWSDLVLRLRSELPDIPLTLWCNEDTPLIWGDLVRSMAGLEPDAKITGAFDILGEIMSPEGMKRFRAYLKEHPVMTEPQKRRVMAAFLDKFYIAEEVEEELDIPGWDEAMVDALTEDYEADVATIERLPGVRFLAP